MNPTDTNPTTPSPEFLDHLEWQVESEARRSSRFNRIGRLRVQPRVSTRSLMVLFLMMVAATSVGAVGAIAVSSQAQQEETELAELRAATHLELAQATVEHFSQSLAELEALAEAGAVSDAELHAVRQERSAAEMEARLAESQLREIRARRAPAEDHLGARRVRGHDYVAERIHIRLEHAVLLSEHARENLHRLETMHERGLVSAGEMNESRMHLRQTEHELLLLSRMIELRQAVVDDAMLPIVAELEAHKVELRIRLEGAVGALGQLEEEMARVTALVERQMASSREMRELELQARHRHAEIRLLEAELGIVERRLKERQPEAEPKKD